MMIVARKNRLILPIITVGMFWSGMVPDLFAWNENVTHPALSARAAYSSVLNQGVLPTLGFSVVPDAEAFQDPQDLTRIVTAVQWVHPEVRRWIQAGAISEDAGSAILFTGRFYRHFHDPLAPNWTQAGLWAYQSSLLWAQGQTTNPEWSWSTVRHAYYDALTDTGSDRQSRFKTVFEGVGHLIHLVQDLAQPAHVRNDPHPLDGKQWVEGLETWAVKRALNVADYARAPVSPTLPLDMSVNGLSPITQFWDRDFYDGTVATRPQTDGLSVGLAEHTNANYFSEDTVDMDYPTTYPFPSRAPADYSVCEFATRPGSIGHRETYLCAKDDPTKLIAAISPLQDPDRPLMLNFNPELSLDNRVRESYASRLIPRAVGYSAALIDYFFRNDIEITPPERFVYGLTTADGAFTEIRLKARNITSTGEPLSGGTIQLVLTYRQALEDPYRANLGGPVPTSAEATTIVVPVANGVTSIPSDVPVELVFNLPSNDGLPRLITDLYAQVVYRGAWGDEADAVVVGYKDFSEPTPIDVMNLMDYVCINDRYLVAGSPEAFSAGDLNGDGALQATEPDIYAHGLKDVMLRFSSASAPEDVTNQNYTVRFSSIGPAQYGRVFVLTDPEFALSSKIVYENTNVHDDFHGGSTFTVVVPRLKNQDEVTELGRVTTYPVLLNLRGHGVWLTALPYQNKAYPNGAECSEVMTATPDLVVAPDPPTLDHP